MKLNRRNMIINSVGIGAATLYGGQLLAEDKISTNNKSVIWVWLGGGPSHFETFNAVGTQDGFQSVIGSLHTPNSPIVLGGLWENLSNHADICNVVANFSHGDSAHEQGTHWMNTGHYNADRANTATSKYPSFGSIVSAVCGPTNKDGIPTYVTQNRIDGDGPAWLGGAYKGFDPSSKDNLSPNVEVNRLTDRKNLLNQLDRAALPGDLGVSMAKYQRQAFDVVLGDAKKAFSDLEWSMSKEAFGDTNIGKQLWYAHRLATFGSKFITIHHGGWDMHTDIKHGLESRVPEVDRALGGLFTWIKHYKMIDDVMVIVTGEFGRTKLNAGNGRDHWPSITPLLIAGGDYSHNRVIGKVDEYNYKPDSNPYGPIDLQATIFDHLSIDKRIMRVDTSGRPRYLLEGNCRNILV